MAELLPSSEPKSTGETTSSPVETVRNPKDGRSKLRYCETCNEQKPLKKFRFHASRDVDEDGNKAGIRWVQSKVCIDCRNKQREKNRLAKKREQNGIVTDRLFRHVLATDKIDVAHISEYVSYLCKEFGGAEELAKAHAEAVKFVNDMDPKEGCKKFEAIAKLIKWSTEYRQTAPDVVNLNDADLEREARKLMGELAARPSGEN